MSKSVVNTREKILDKALEMFNERGIEYVGLRELAAILGIRVSNITYYFPTKDDLVFQLSLELSKKNAEIITAKADITMGSFLQMLHKVLQNQVTFRCLLLSFVHLMKQNKHIAEAYKKTQANRKATIKSNIESLFASGYLNVTNDEKDFLVSTLSLVSRFWISEAAVSFQHLGTDAQIRHYLMLTAKLLQPYATAKGKKEIDGFIESVSVKS
jgi:AcrR family transcriptional regulator